MLNVIIYDSVQSSLIKLADMVNLIIKSNNMEACVKFLALSPNSIFDAPIDKNDNCLFILEFGTENLAVFHKIRSIYSHASIIFFSDAINISVLKASLTGDMRPSGFIEKPVRSRNLSESFMDVYVSYKNSVYSNDETQQVKSINVTVGGRIYVIPLTSIIYFEAFDKKINLFTNNQCISYYESLSRLENQYHDSFVRCHKSFLANIQKIESVLLDEMFLVMSNQSRIPISRTYKNNVKEAMRLTP